jgi:hypothetical protein
MIRHLHLLFALSLSSVCVFAADKPVTYVAEMSGMVCAGCKDHVTTVPHQAGGRLQGRDRRWRQAGHAKSHRHVHRPCSYQGTGRRRAGCLRQHLRRAWLEEIRVRTKSTCLCNGPRHYSALASQPVESKQWTGVRVVYRARLESVCTLIGTEGSNPSLSATTQKPDPSGNRGITPNRGFGR